MAFFYLDLIMFFMVEGIIYCNESNIVKFNEMG